MIKISLNKELDYEIYVDFHNLSVAGADFGQEIRNNHPNINIENYKKYIDEFYITNQIEIKNKQEQINKFLSEKQNKFYLALKDIFQMDFSNDIYRGYFSIFNCNPRWPKTKTFQVFYKKDLPHMLEVAYHESLHFAFFDYCDKNLIKETGDLDKNTGPLWELSEIFNIIILNLPEFREIIEMEEILFYTELQDKLDRAKEIWSLCGNIKEFIPKYLNKIK
jgi:hypothetical protein